MFGGSPHIVAEPPRFAQKISDRIIGTGLNFSSFASSTVTAARKRITVKIAGGAKMFEVTGGNLGNIGQRNIESVHTVLRKEGIRLMAEDVGGTVARTLLFDVVSGQGCIRSYGRQDVLF